MNDEDCDDSVDRRAFVRAASVHLAAIAIGSRVLSGQAPAGPGLKIGMILPQARTDAVEGAIAGIELGLDEAARSAALFHKRVAFARKSFTSAQDSASAATDLVLGENATVLVGGGDDEACRAITNVCLERGAVFINVISRSDDLRRTNCSPLVLHLEASDAMYSAARKIVDAQTTTSSPPNCDVVLWHSSLERYGAAQLNDRFSAKFGRPMTGSSWAGWMAVKAATEAFFRTGANDAGKVAAYMSSASTQFDGHKGAPLSFRTWDHQLRQPLYCVPRKPGGASPQVRDIPDLARSNRPARELLDELGDASAAGLCKSAGR